MRTFTDEYHVDTKPIVRCLMNRVHSLTGEEIAALERLHRQTEDANVRSRCDMILLSIEKC